MENSHQSPGPNGWRQVWVQRQGHFSIVARTSRAGWSQHLAGPDVAPPYSLHDPLSRPPPPAGRANTTTYTRTITRTRTSSSSSSETSSSRSSRSDSSSSDSGSSWITYDADSATEATISAISTALQTAVGAVDGTDKVRAADAMASAIGAFAMALDALADSTWWRKGRSVRVFAEATIDAVQAVRHIRGGHLLPPVYPVGKLVAEAGLVRSMKYAGLQKQSLRDKLDSSLFCCLAAITPIPHAEREAVAAAFTDALNRIAADIAASTFRRATADAYASFAILAAYPLTDRQIRHDDCVVRWDARRLSGSRYFQPG